MGGSGPNAYPPGSASDCEDIRFKASVNSPQPEALDDLEVGDVLTISATDDEEGIIVWNDDEEVGTLTGTMVAKMLNCMQSEYIFQATVLEISEGYCLVQVELA
ncbi:MAG: hypothetical protein CVU73_14720 [Deltaproteobacteria bacterium HGW-Deltaproteobacteria-8]|nr:MAG: hypothetical protein CVU73_14720 [Deltaproteobacteria bacterium HGW-Deltaproteobacteria-8]